MRHTLSVDMNYTDFQQFAAHWNQSVGHKNHHTVTPLPPPSPLLPVHKHDHYLIRRQFDLGQVNCNLPYGNGRSCAEGWSNGAAYGYKVLGLGLGLGLRLGLGLGHLGYPRPTITRCGLPLASPSHVIRVVRLPVLIQPCYVPFQVAGLELEH